MALRLYTKFVALSTAVLIFAGGLVTSTGSGLSVPDWPTTYGWNMFLFPLEKMVGGIRYEHSHRLIASTVGLLILVLAVWLWRSEPRAWVRRLGYIALVAVVTQGILGGITVLWYLPDPISIAHASLAQIVLCLTTAIALFISKGWSRSDVPAVNDALLGRVTIVTTAWIYVQILLGATMRHTDAGLAIPDFPLAFGQLIPPHWDAKIAIHFAHRIGALVASFLIVAATAHVFYHHRRHGELVRPSVLLLVLLAAQITLGAYTVLSERHYIINSLHVVTGASVLVTSLVLTVRANKSSLAILWRVPPASAAIHGGPADSWHRPAATRARA
jgi:heme a synthase